MRPAGTSTAWLYCANGARIEAGLIGRFMDWLCTVPCDEIVH